MKIKNPVSRNKLTKMKNRYDELIEEFNIITNTYALDYWKIIKEASDIGLEIFGVSFSQQKLAEDFGVGRKSIGRCLALANMNKRTEKLIKTGKISASRVVPILTNTNKEFQDEIIDKVLKEGITFEQIQRNLPIFSNVEEIKTWNFKNPVLKLNKNEHTINSHFLRKITDLSFLLTADTSNIEDKDELIIRIKELQSQLDYFINKLNGIALEDDESMDSLDDIEEIL